MTPAFLLSLADLHEIATRRPWTREEADRAAEELHRMERAAQSVHQPEEPSGLFPTQERP